VQPHSKIVADYLGCTEMQAVFFCIIFEINLNNTNVDLAQIGIHLNVTPMKIAPYNNQLDELFNKRLISKQTKPSRKQTPLNINHYSINRSLMDSILANKKYTPESDNINDVFEFLKYLENIFMDETKTDKLIELSHTALNANQHLPLIHQINVLALDDETIIFFLILCIASLTGDGELALDFIIPQLYDEKKVQLRVKANLLNSRHPLIKEELVYLREEEFISETIIGLSEKGKSIVFGDDFSLVSKVKNCIAPKNMIKVSNITEKKLFFNAEVQEKLNVLKDIFHPDKYTNLVQRLEEANMPKGIVILFHGAPGTGKTEAVFQLAKKTGRDINMVSISETKSKWFGESEKLIKKVFDDYRKLVESSLITPILLFNEADAIFGTRGKIGRYNIDQTQNAIQNIILQELESFTGILIATTNLTENFDNAFERRFLYKIKFESPSLEARANIWKEKISSITKNQALKLSENHELSGGQIDNIGKKYLLKQILYRKKPSLTELESFCFEENLNRRGNSHPIGFKIPSSKKVS
jgi:hypothetical protein